MSSWLPPSFFPLFSLRLVVPTLQQKCFYRAGDVRNGFDVVFDNPEQRLVNATTREIPLQAKKPRILYVEKSFGNERALIPFP
jgi:hypothetical protein